MHYVSKTLYSILMHYALQCRLASGWERSGTFVNENFYYPVATVALISVSSIYITILWGKGKKNRTWWSLWPMFPGRNFIFRNPARNWTIIQWQLFNTYFIGISILLLVIRTSCYPTNLLCNECAWLGKILLVIRNFLLTEIESCQ